MSTQMPVTRRPLDIALGERLRTRRKAAGVTQSQLARAVGLTFQQIQKYEKGTNRVSFSRLVEIAHALECRAMDLIGDLDEAVGFHIVEPVPHGLNVDGADHLLAAYASLSPPLRAIVVKLVATLADLGKGGR